MSVSWGARSPRSTTILSAFLLLVCTCLLAVLARPTALPGAAAPEASRGDLNLPRAFVPNRGQLDSKLVRYYTQGPASTMYFTKRMAAISMSNGDRGAALHMRFIGASPHARLVAHDGGTDRVNYISASEQHTSLPTYEALTYRNLWPGIDMTFRSGGSNLKYEFVVRPGADPSAIQLAYVGGAAPVITQAGELRVATAAGPLTDAKPHSYQLAGRRRTPVRSRFVLRAGRSHGFALSRYDTRRPLVIDPELSYSTFLGGSSSDQPFGIDTDPQGNAYVAGITHSLDFPTTPGAFQTTARSFNMFVTKLNANGSALEYSTFLGSQYEEARGVAVDEQGNAFVTGFTTSPDFPTTAGAYDTSQNGSYDVFLSKLNAAGSGLLYSTYLGGSSFEGATAIALGADGSAYLTGNSASSDFSTTPGAFQTTNLGGNDVFVTRVSPSGSSLVYSTLLGSSSSNEFAYSLGVDGSGNAYTTGRTDSGSFPTTPGAFDPTGNGGDDAFLSKISADGTSLLASTFLGGPGFEVGTGAATDAADQPYVAGITRDSPAFPTTPDAYDTTPDGGDGFLTKLDPALSHLTYSTFLGGGSPGGTFGGHSLEVDGRGRAHVTGSGGSGVFVKRFDPTGSQLTYSTDLGGPLLETSAGIALGDGAREAYVSGMTDSSDFPTTPGAYDTDHDGTSDGFVTKLLLQPRSTPGCKVSGGGRITAANGDRATFSGSARAASDRDVSGNLDYVDHGPAAPFRLRSLTIDALVCDGARATILGLARVDGSQVEFTIDLLDAGEPGRSDTYRLRLSNGYDSGTRTLGGGNVQVSSR
jgi:beta-propeller repeat-containing protein